MYDISPEAAGKERKKLGKTLISSEIYKNQRSFIVRKISKGGK